MAMKKKAHGGGGHGGWFVSFADLMALLMAFFVMLLSFSVQDEERMNMAAGSMRDAFGIQPYSDMTGMIEREGNPQRNFVRTLSRGKPNSPTKGRDRHKNQGQEANTWAREKTDIARAQEYALAAASLRQAFQDLPDIAALSRNILIEPSEDGVDIVIADQEGRAMFPEGSKYPYEITRKAIAAMAPALQKLGNPIKVSGHTAAGGTYDQPRYGPWELSFDRANVTRQVLEEYGLSGGRMQSVIGRAAADPFFPNDPYLAANQRVTISVVFQQPPVPVGLNP